MFALIRTIVAVLGLCKACFSVSLGQQLQVSSSGSLLVLDMSSVCRFALKGAFQNSSLQGHLKQYSCASQLYLQMQQFDQSSFGVAEGMYRAGAVAV